MHLTINQTSPSFGEIVQPRQMEEAGSKAVGLVRNYIEHDVTYRRLDKTLFDIYFLKPTKRHTVRAAFFDNKNESFVRNSRGETFIVSSEVNLQETPGQALEIAQRVIDKLQECMHGEHNAPYWYHDPNNIIGHYLSICKKNDIEPRDDIQIK